VKQGLCFNKSLVFNKYPARSASRELRHETSCDNRQLCGLSTDSLVLFHIQCRSIAPFVYYLSYVYISTKACNYGENYLKAKMSAIL